MTDKERKLALYCLKASSDYHSEVCEACIKYPNCDHIGQDDVTETIIEALEQTRWIPVSERPPEDGQKVLVTTQNGNIIDVDICIYHHASPFWKHFVIAWMPRPESYKGGEE